MQMAKSTESAAYYLGRPIGELREPFKEHGKVFGAVRVMMITKHLPDLIHKLYAGIGAEFSFVFHNINEIP